MSVNKLIQDAIKTISEQAVSVAPYDKTRGGVIKGVGDAPNTYSVQVDGVIYTNVKTVGGIAPSINDTVTVIFPTNNSSQMVINSVSTQSWIKGASEFIYPIGAYYWTSDGDFNPNDSFSGTWEQIDAGITLVSAGTGYTVQSGTAKDGGAETVSLTDREMAHGHGFTQPTVNGGGGSATGAMSENANHTHPITYIDYYRQATTSGSTAVSFAGSSQTKISGNANIAHTHNIPNHTHSVTGGAVDNLAGASSTRVAHENMPPYKCAYCWHRVA